MPSVLSAIGATFLGIAQIVGGMGLLLSHIAERLFRRDVDPRQVLDNLYKMGVKSLPIVVLTALFTGGIMVVQAAPIIERYGAEGLLGWATGFGTLREIGPLLTALMISGRVGANNTAELGTMIVTEQVDALRALAIDPIGFLIAPRFFAIVATLLLATIFADVLALVGSAYVGYALLGISPEVYFNGITSGLITFGDVAHGLVKAVVFGVVMGLSSCQFGLSTTGGAPGVGRAVNATVVVTAAGIFVLDYLVSFAFK